MKKGDCNEIATLSLALLRAAGIPSKFVVGLVYINDAFYYHAWNEVYDGKKWVAVDFALGEVPAGILHIKLGEGDISNYLKIINIIGNLKIKVLEQK